MKIFKIFLTGFSGFFFSSSGRSGAKHLKIFALCLSLLVFIPLIIIFSSLFAPSDKIWEHIYENVLSELLLNTFSLIIGVSIGTLIIGVLLAWLTSIYEFPGRKIFSWTLMMPLAMPVYVIAFVSIGILEYTGPVQTFLREYYGRELHYFPRIRSTVGIILIMTLALYPYVYLLARNAFLSQGKRALEIAQSLGYSRKSAFLKSALPLARPWIAGGVLLVIMEALSDFGAVSIFNFNTLTTEIYKAWFSLFSIQTASQLASLLVIIVFLFILLEQRSRYRMRFYQPGKTAFKQDLIKLRGMKSFIAFFFCLTILLIAFIIPFIQILAWAASGIKTELNQNYIKILSNSLLLAGIAALITAGMALLLSFGSRFNRDKFNNLFVKISTLGYALPGAVLAVAILLPFAWLDNNLITIVDKLFGIESGRIFSGTLLALLTAYLIRFLAVAHNSIESDYHRVSFSIDESAASMGVTGADLLKKVHLPIIRNGIFAAIILVFVDVMKEMPITLMTRPFGWDTLAVRIFELTSEGEWIRAALPAVTIVLAGLIPVRLLMKYSAFK
ncbi:MAG: iron ABC transporter permease [Ignavibacterium sp.]|nr:iron ABC transporter permease [Ignavibacterium sp.]